MLEKDSVHLPESKAHHGNDDKKLVREMLSPNGRLLQQVRDWAVLEERNRLAQDLHDNVAQVLGYLNVELATTRRLLTTGRVAEAETNLDELRQIVRECYTDVREEIFNLKAKVSSGLGFVDTLHKYVAKYRRYYHLDIHLVLDMDKFALEIPMDVGSQIIRIIQEALINVRKHAQVSEVLIRIERQADRLYISVEDSGQGFDVAQTDVVGQNGKSGLGLEIMRERAERIGGRVRISSEPGQGTKIGLWIPITGPP